MAGACGAALYISLKNRKRPNEANRVLGIHDSRLYLGVRQVVGAKDDPLGSTQAC
jgi:hypothetical protein